MAADDEGTGLVLKLIICLIAAASAAVVVTVYHCITAKQHTHHRRRDPTVPPPDMTTAYDLETMSMENSVAELLPARKFEKGVVEDDASCAICLCEFEDGEEVRTLPECAHSFHAPCIDMWLYSHSNCPVCRRTLVGLEYYSSPPLMHLLHTSNLSGSSNFNHVVNTAN
ncbi:hypothetical protein ABFS83_06G077800 [Erythranthe nasuta]